MAKSNDEKKLLAALKRLSEGNYEPIDISEFEDSEIGEMYRECFDKIANTNNVYLARINKAMEKIGDSQSIRNMFEEITSNLSTVNTMMDSSTTLTSASEVMASHGQEILVYTRQVRNTLKPCVKDLEETALLIEELSKSEMDADMQKKLSDKARTIKQNIDTLSGMSERLSSVSDITCSVASVITEQAADVETFISLADQITTSYQKLSVMCLETGKYYFGISRKVDDVRNDMFRQWSKPTAHDSLNVFEIDHLVLTWRLYNNMVEFESLMHSQVDNPTGCKFGKWCENLQNPDIKNAECLAEAMKKHDKFHEYATKCFEANADSDREEAMAEFNLALSAYEEFRRALAEVHIFLTLNGIADETEIPD